MATNQGTRFFIPNITTLQRMLQTGANGELVFDTTLNRHYSGTGMLGQWRPLSMAPRGTYVAGETYYMNDLVNSAGQTWIARRDNTNVQPVDGEDWMPLLTT